MMAYSEKIRLDALLVQRHLAESRAQANSMIRAGLVRSGGEVLNKPGKSVPDDLEVFVVRPLRFVSRGGEKLAAYLDSVPIATAGIDAIDVGASTGGFTDCLLQNGAAHVTCIDVGYGQLHQKLRGDTRVVSLERINARDLSSALLPRPQYHLAVLDLSFISLKKVLPSVWPIVREQGHLLALVKPQFEAQKAEIDRGRGIIRDPQIHQRVVTEIRDFARNELSGSREIGCIQSPITGGDGNQEFLLGFIKENAS